MKTTRHIRLLSLILVAFMSTAMIARAVSLDPSIELHSNTHITTSSDAPCGSDHQYPFEEKEKEFEDKSESGKEDAFAPIFFLICEVSIPTSAHDANRTGRSSCNESSGALSAQHLPLFLSKRTLLI